MSDKDLYAGVNANDLIKVFNSQGRHIPDREKKPLANRKENLIFKVGIIQSIDERKQEMFIKLENDGGYALNIPISQPFAGTNSYIAGMPDEGSLVILGYQEAHNRYFPLAYMPNYLAALEGKTVKLWDDKVIQNAGINDFFYRYRRLSKGEIAIASSKGPELFLSDSINLTSGVGDSLIVKDHSFISTSYNNYEFTSGVWKNSGIAFRNSLKIIDSDSIFKETQIDGGKDFYSLKADRISGIGGKFFTEYLIEVTDTAMKLPSNNDVNSNSNDSDKKSPISVFSMGNFIGNNPEKYSTYGKILKVSLFNDRDDQDGSFKLVPISGADAESSGMAFAMYKPERRDYERGAFFGIDKEGRFFQFNPAVGVSTQILSMGSKKEVWGQDSYGNSMDITLKGGLKLTIGKHNSRDPSLAGKSLVINLTGNVSHLYGNDLNDTLYDITDDTKLIQDATSYSLIHKVEDKERYEVQGSREKKIGGKETIVVEGIKDETIGSDYNLLVTGKIIQNASDIYRINAKGKEESVGYRKTTITQGASELTMNSAPVFGVVLDIKETILGFGSRSFSTSNGDIKETILVKGNRSFSTTSGDVSFNTKLGNITMQSTAGNITIKTNAGNMDLIAKALMNVTTQASVSISGSNIDLKGKGVLGGVVTSLTHHDYITGAFLVGSQTVKST